MSASVTYTTGGTRGWVIWLMWKAGLNIVLPTLASGLISNLSMSKISMVLVSQNQVHTFTRLV